MLAVVVKNFILVFLIIMIIHFMIKNYEADLIVHRRMMCGNAPRQATKKNSVSVAAPAMVDDGTPHQPKVSVDMKPTEESTSSPSDVVATAAATAVPSLDPDNSREAIDELYEFVFNDSGGGAVVDDKLGALFEETLTTEKLERGCDVLCPDQPKKDEKNFCLNRVDSVFKAAGSQKSVVKEHTTPKGVLGTETMKTSQGFQILYEYKDDNQSDNLMGFETFESNYMTL